MDASLSEAAFSAALYGALAPGVGGVDRSVQAVLESQTVLRTQLDRLHTELEAFAAAADVPPLVPYVTKLAASRKVLRGVNAKIARVDKRLETIRALVRRKLLLEERRLPLCDAPDEASAAEDVRAHGRSMASISDLLDWDSAAATAGGQKR